MGATRRSTSSTQRDISTVFRPLSSPRGPYLTAARWLEDQVALELEFSAPVVVSNSGTPGVHVRDANDVPLRAKETIENHTDTIVRVKCGYDPDGITDQPTLTMNTENLGHFLSDPDGLPVHPFSVVNLERVAAVNPPTVIDALFSNDGAPVLIVYMNTKSNYEGGSDEVKVADRNGNTFANASSPQQALGGGGRFEFTDFFTSGGTIDPGTMGTVDASWTSVDTSQSNSAASQQWLPLVEEPAVGPYLVSAEFSTDDGILHLTFSEDVILFGSAAGAVTLATNDSVQYKASGGIDATDETVRIQMAFNLGGAAAAGLASSNRIGFSIRSATSGRPATDFTAVAFFSPAPEVGPVLLDAAYSVSSGLLTLTFDEALVVAANPATAGDIRIRKPGSVDTTKNAVGVALITTGNQIIGVPCATVDNSTPCAASTTSSFLSPGNITDTSLNDAVAWTDFPIRLVA